MKKKESFSIKEIINNDKDYEIIDIEKPKKQTKSKALTTNEFFEQYKDPRWQKKRLKIMERDEFMCISCQDSDNTLNVHHRVLYRKDTKPWEYEDDELITLCEDCHKELTGIIKECNSIVARNCFVSDFAGEFNRILKEIDGMNPYQLMVVWKTIELLKNY